MFKNRKMLLFIVMFLFMFIGVNRVEAWDSDLNQAWDGQNAGSATGMYCIYNDGVTGYYTMLVQDTYGERNFYYIDEDAKVGNSGEPRYDSFAWEGGSKDFTLDGSVSKDSNDNLTSCPKYYRKDGNRKDGNTFADKKDGGIINQFDYPLIEKKSSIFTDTNIHSYSFLHYVVAGSSQYIVNDSNYNENTYKEQWLVTPQSDGYTQSCLYSKAEGSGSAAAVSSIQLDINFDTKKVRISSGGRMGTGSFSSVSKIDSNYYYSYIENHYRDRCPLELFAYVGFGGSMDTLYFSYTKKSKSINSDDPGSDLVTLSSYNLTNSSPDVGQAGIIIEENIITFDNCEEMLGEELVGMLSTGVNILKILVALILIGFGTYDFAQAVISSKEDEMKKASSRFIKRIIIAVIIFLIPSILKILLVIASQIWGNVDPELCGIL